MAIYVLVTVILTMMMNWFAERFDFGMIDQLAFNTICILCFVSYILHNDLPLSSLPVIGKKFKR
jgi:hypothetical protein